METPNRTLRILFACNAVFVFAGNLLGPLFAVFVQGINNKVMAISGSWGIYLASMTLFMFLLTRLRDRNVHKKQMLILGYVVRALGWLLYSLVKDFGVFLLIQVVFGLGAALGTPAFDAIFAEHLDEGKHVADYSDWEIVSNLVVVAATFIGGLIVASFGFQALFYVMAALAFLAAGATYLSLRRV